MTIPKDDDKIQRISGYSGADLDANSYRRAAFEKLGYWYHGQDYFRRVHDLLWLSGFPDEYFDIFMPVLHLEKFVHLDHVETTGCPQQELSKQPLIQFDEARSRLNVETLDLTTEEYGQYQPKANSCLDIFILAANQAQKGISSLTVTSIDEIARDPWRRLDMTSLRTLRLDFAAAAVEMYEMIRTHRFSTWFQSATSLKNLTLIQGPLDSTANLVINFFALLRENAFTFPMLECVDLQYVTTHVGILRTFLEQHRKTLLSLKIDRPYILADDWDILKQEILAGTSSGALGPKVASKVVLTDAVTPGLLSAQEWRQEMVLIPKSF